MRVHEPRPINPNIDWAKVRRHCKHTRTTRTFVGHNQWKQTIYVLRCKACLLTAWDLQGKKYPLKRT